tara:strand:+ start:3053 stop:3616 length:564 start_codon:yes stop_codon:yes gene_type:complete
MSVAIETAELISALQAASKEALDVIEATEDATERDLAARGHNAVRDAAKDAHNICNNLLKRLGKAPVLPPKPETSPDPIEQPEPEAPAQSNGEAAEAVLEQMDQLEEVQEVLSEVAGDPEPEQPPASIADLFQPDKPLAPQARALREKWLEIGHQVQRGEASADDIRKHERLSSELEFINRHAFDGI